MKKDESSFDAGSFNKKKLLRRAALDKRFIYY